MFRLIGGLLGLSGAVVMAYFHFFASTTNSQISWLGAALFIVGLLILLAFRSKGRPARSGHGASSPEA